MNFRTEAELCAAFIEAVPKGWIAYPETQGFDILLVHQDGAQIGIEAKLILNTKVLVQVAQDRDSSYHGGRPDFRACLVGRSVAETAALAKIIGVTVLELRASHSRSGKYSIFPVGLPEMRAYKAGDYWYGGQGPWHDEAPAERLTLPEYVPHVVAGRPAPIKLSGWTIAAMKACILAARLGYLTRQHFVELRLSPSRWFDGYWMIKGETRGQWVPGPSFPTDRFKNQHPITWAEIEADWPKWGDPLVAKIGGPT
jgi:hypothetical protein